MSQPDILKIVSHYKPFDTINESLLKKLVELIEIKVAEPGKVLFSAGDYDVDEYYLVKGKVSLNAKDGRQSILEPGMSNIRYPIARLRPRMFTAKAVTKIYYFVVSKSVLDELQLSIQESNKDSMFEEMRAKSGADGSTLLEEFQQELDKGRFVLPSLPEVALQIGRKIEDPECSINDIATLVNSDPAIAVKLIKTANSVIYRGVKPYADTQAAISRLGLVTTKQLVTSFAILELFQPESHAFKEYMQQIWRQSIEVAAYSYVIAKSLPTLDESEAMLAGLLHNIGELAVLSYAGRFYDLVSDENQLMNISMILRGKVGGMILEKWGFSAELVTVARESSNWLRESNSDFDYCDLVQVASLYAIESHGGESELPKMQSVPAFQNLALSQEQANQVVEAAQDQINEIRSLFSSSS